jgi:4-hydroxy-tetrahydrodipicolinate synthase
MITPFEEDGRIDWSGLEHLIEWYISGGSAGLFANCLSSEMYQLSPAERIELTRFVVQRVAGRIPVVSSGTFQRDAKANAAFIQQIRAAGAAAVVVISNQLGPADQGDEAWLEELQQLAHLCEGIPLGVYECPLPYKRLLTPAQLSWMEESGQFLYYKETSCHLPSIQAKLSAGSGGSLGLFNANTPTALASLRAGAAGLSTIGANFYPELYALLCQYSSEQQSEIDWEYLQTQLSVMDAVTRVGYHWNVRYFLRLRGLPIGFGTRQAYAPLSTEEQEILRQLWKMTQRLLKRYQLEEAG